jgi:hypothetical protein
VLAAVVATSLLSVLLQILFWTIGIGLLVGFVVAVNASSKKKPKSGD